MENQYVLLGGTALLGLASVYFFLSDAGRKTKETKDENQVEEKYETNAKNGGAAKKKKTSPPPKVAPKKKEKRTMDKIQIPSFVQKTGSYFFRKKTGSENRIEEALENSFPMGIEEILDTIDEGKEWVDQDFTFGEIDENSVREGERGKKIQGIKVGWKQPRFFCRSRKPLGKTIDGKPTWLYSDDNGDGIVSAWESMSMDDTNQGSLGDCYFLAALCSAIEANPLIADDLIFEDYEEKGVYGVTLFLDGAWRMIWVDSFFPCYQPLTSRNDRWKLIYAKSTDQKEIWPLVVEKAWARWNGSYESIVGGSVGKALESITGGESNTVPLGNSWNKEKVWQFLLQADQDEKNVFGGGTRNLEASKMQGLVSTHAYTILDFQEVEEGVRLIKMRNPWGQDRWKGAWGDSSREWNSEVGRKLKQHLNLQRNADDGIFWMHFDDVFELFFCIYICTLPHEINAQRLEELKNIHEVKQKIEEESSSSDESENSEEHDKKKKKKKNNKKKRKKKKKRRH